jgi:acetyltransferase-like isoleucine patch superfamily enzyme
MLYRLLAPWWRLSARLRQASRRACLRGQGVQIGPACQIGVNVKAGPQVVLGTGVVVGDNCEFSGAVRLDDGVVVEKHVAIAGNVRVGEASNIGSYSFVSTMPGATVSIGKRVMVNSFNVLGAGERLEIGDDCIFAAYVQITDSSHHFEKISDSPRHDGGFSKPVCIGAGSWLGSAVKVMMGVTVGEGCVVGAGAVVLRDLPAYSVSVGMPAKVIRFRSQDKPQKDSN